MGSLERAKNIAFSEGEVFHFFLEDNPHLTITWFEGRDYGEVFVDGPAVQVFHTFPRE